MTVLGLLVASFVMQGQPFLPTFSTLVTVRPEKVQQRLSASIAQTSHQPNSSDSKTKYQKILGIISHKISQEGSKSSPKKLKRIADLSPVLKTASANIKPLAFPDRSFRLKPEKQWDIPQPSDYDLQQRLLAQHYRGRRLPVLSYGHRGNAVRVLQTLLTYNRYGVGITGNFDVLTETAVKAFQANRGLVADGIVGSRTWGQLTRYRPRRAFKNPMEVPMFGSQPIYPWERSFRGNFAESTLSI